MRNAHMFLLKNFFYVIKEEKFKWMALEKQILKHKICMCVHVCLCMILHISIHSKSQKWWTEFIYGDLKT